MSELSYKIMNIQITKNAMDIRKEIESMNGDALAIYKMGHRDARHAAAELAEREAKDEKD